MADQEADQVKSESALESLLDNVTDKFRGHDSSPSLSVDDRGFKESAKSKIYRLFGRERPVHKVLGGGKAADIFLWKDKKVTASVLGLVTAIWVLFEVVEYHLLTLLCHILILVMSLLFLWSNASKVFKRSPPKIPEIVIREDITRDVASAIRTELNAALAELRAIASGKDLKKLLAVLAGLWVLSVVGACLNFLTLFYVCFVLLHTVPVVYDKYEDQVDAFAEKAEAELKKQYANVLSKIPKGPLKDKFH